MSEDPQRVRSGCSGGCGSRKVREERALEKAQVDDDDADDARDDDHDDDDDAEATEVVDAVGVVRTEARAEKYVPKAKAKAVATAEKAVDAARTAEAAEEIDLLRRRHDG